MKKISICLSVFLITLVGCQKEVVFVETGDLSVSVVSEYSEPIENVDVYTKPPTKQGKTDAFGSVLLKDLEIGSYEVYASLKNVGSGKSIVNIKLDDITESTIRLIRGANVGIVPTIELILPTLPAEFAQGEKISFSADVSDDKTPVTSLKTKWVSNLDGVLNSNPPSPTGNSSFSTTSLSRGIHEITLTVEDGDGYQSSKTIEISTLSPKSITLYPPVKNKTKVVLSWSKIDGQSFNKYEIFRTNGDGTSQNNELIASINDVNTVSFVDENPPLKYQVGYYVRVTNAEGYARSSNEELVELPAGPIFNFTASDMLNHPSEPFIYLVDKSGQKLYKIDYENNTIVASTSIQGTVGKCVIGDNGVGVEIYVPSSDGFVYVYDANDLSLATKIHTEKVNSSVSIDGLGHIVVALDPSPDAWWTNPLRSFNRSNGMLIDGNGDFESDIVKRIPGKTEFIAISTSVSPVDMDYYKLASNGSFEIHLDDKYHGDHPLDPYIFDISDNGEYVITSSSGAVYLANSTMEYKGQFGPGTLQYSDFAFSSDGAKIYAATSNRKSIQIGSYPALIRTEEILLRGYPVFVVRKGQKLIVLIKSDENSNTSGIEVKEL
jgi:hypothetical protein